MTQVITEQNIQAAVEIARATCLAKGSDSRECAASWDIVAEMELAIAQRQTAKSVRTALDVFCDTHPDALECRMFDL